MLHAAIAQALERGALILTPNQRAARAIRRAFDAAQTGGLWTPPEVLPLDSWLTQLWQRRIVVGLETRTVLNATQQHALWRGIIAADAEVQGLRSTDSLAELAARAWTLACLHEGRHRLREFPLATDHRAFERWARSFERRLDRGGWITPAQLAGELAKAAGLPKIRLALVDFDSNPPAVAGLLKSLREQGASVASIDTGAAAGGRSLCAASDERAELLSAARWSRRILDRNPRARIAIVVPDLEERRAAIERAFAPVLRPESLPITAPAAAAVYEFSLGRVLGELPLALTAMDLLMWPLNALPLERIGALLLSPWFTSQDDAKTAVFEAYTLRKLHVLRPELTLAATIRVVRAQREPLPDLLHRLRSLERAAQEADREFQPFSGWADTFRRVLDAAGWTRYARSSSLAFQQHDAWEGALDELATLDFDAETGALPRVGQALDALKRILDQTMFAPESSDAPVQILGPLELGGVAFDALWFLGADDLAWPATASSTPLLPWQMQRTLGMPGADRAGDDGRAVVLTRRIAQAAAEVVFSYSEQAEDGERRPSPLLMGLDLRRVEPEPEAAVVAAPFEMVVDDTTLPALPPGIVPGGSAVLKLQAACGFRAFAERRLHSTPLRSQAAGFDAGESGGIVHAVMETFWNEVKTQAALKALDAAGCAAVLQRAIAASVQSTAENAWEEAYLAVQRERLHDLLLPWLALEAGRPPFSVQPTEQEKQFALGPLTFNLRIDRIDSTADGDVILDYKTGVAAPSQWQGARPDEPQLPLYSVLAQAEGRNVAGVAFVLLRAGQDLAIKGYAENDRLFAGTKPARMDGATLEAQIHAWHATLYTLAEAFAAGDTRVLPKDYPKTCRHCGQRVLCRLNPETLGLSDEEDEEASDG